MSSPPDEFSLRIQHGIVGGFAPPTPDAIHILSRIPDDPSNILIQSAVRPSGQPELQQAAPQALAAFSDSFTADDSSPKNGNARIAELISILSSIPTEQPPGSEDIYGMNTGIAFQCGDFVWMNGGPQGCSGGVSEVQPTEEDKAKFRRAVEIVQGLVEP
ncbi:hypothetical protein FRB99_003153 [Tulasnella sp. 403]|nr:hypothetical protein FRB99_003153 [Tulasnella sp. 403]